MALDIEVEAQGALKSPCFRYQFIHTKGATASCSTGTIHGRASLNGSSHPTISLEGVRRRTGGLQGLSLRHER